MTRLTDLFVQKAQEVAGVRVGSTDAAVTKAYDRQRETRKSVDGYGQTPTVPAAGNRTQPRDEGGKFLSASTANQTPGGGQQLDGQTQRPGDYRGNADTEGSASRGAGSIVQSALDRGRANISQYKQHTVAGAIAEDCAKRQITVFGHQAGVQASPEATFQSRLVDASSDIGDHTFMSFQASVQRLVDAFADSTGRRPVWGSPRDQQDVEFQIAYRKLRAQYWPDGTDEGTPGGQSTVQ
jgi:hypothetical protein